MPGKKSSLSPLAARKQLLLLESQLNRAEFLEAIQEWKDEFNHTKEQLTSFTSMASIAGRVASVIPTIRNLFSRRKSTDGKSRTGASFFKSMMTGTSLWLLLRALRRK